MQQFLDDDAGYLVWLRRNPWGLVVNTERTPTPRYLKLHLASCRTISVLSGKGTNFTRSYRKVCATSRAELDTWARSIGGALDPCPTCHR